MRQRARDAIERTFGVKVRPRVILQTEKRFLRRLHQRGVRDARWDTFAAYREGDRIFMNREFAAFVPANHVHEHLHVAAAPAWAAGIDARGLPALDEGVTELFTERAARRAGFRFEVAPGYGGGRDLAGAIERLVGARALRRAYFRDGLAALESAVDARAGAGAFARATRELQAGRTAEAIAALAR